MDRKLEVLNTAFGYSSFRPGQEILIDAQLNGTDALGIMPTGGGKSICYQIPAMLLQGITLVISPLISLMQDQVAALKAAGIPAAYINSSLTPRQIDLVYRYMAAGRYKIIYVAPERLLTPGFLQAAVTLPISLLVVDEAHCISQWGRDFRPSYLKIPDFVDRLPRRPVLSAFTATATEQVREDIVSALQLQKPVTIITGFDRPNLRFEVRQPMQKSLTLLSLVGRRKDKCGIIYCATRKDVESVCEQLRSDGVAATRYHAGLTDEERRKNQEDFLYDRARVMVATNAFGMGIDKSNVAYVIHYSMPKSIESYYQEAGRAGRDGSKAECILLYSPADIHTAQFLIEKGAENSELSPQEARRVMREDLNRLNRMIHYCQTAGCLRGNILSYFGQEHPVSCGNCSNCNTMAKKREAAPEPDARTGIELYQELEKLRDRIARRQGVPGYLIFTDATLEDMALKMPVTPAQLRSVSGVSQYKAERHGKEFLKLIKRFRQNQQT